MCQSALWSQPGDNGNTPFHEEYSKCPLIGQSGFTGLYSQHIQKVSMNDSKMYQCVNRGDESPFSLDDKETDDWLELVTEPCPAQPIIWEWNAPLTHRRCLGQRPDQCVDALSSMYLKTDWKRNGQC
jgi:hypothetical protein